MLARISRLVRTLLRMERKSLLGLLPPVREKDSDMNKNSTDPHRVWIELEYPEGGNCKDGDIRAARASALLTRLGHHMKEVFWWNSRVKKYCVTIDEGGGFLECTDNGHWFNLDYLGREEEKAA